MSCYEVPPNIAQIVGPVLVGYIINWVLFGVLSVQVYSYYIAFPRDRWPTKTLVYGIYSLEIVQTFMTTNDAFDSLARGFGDVLGLTKMRHAWFYVSVMGALIASIGQIFYAYRIMVVSRGSVVAPTIVVLVSLVQCGAGFATGIQNARLGSFAPELQRTIVTSITVWLVGSAACDVIIAALMTYYLRVNGKSTLKKTQLLVAKVIRLSLETGIMTATIMSLGLIVFLAFPDNAYFPAFTFTFTKWYSNTILVILNSRMNVVGGRDHISAVHVMSSGWMKTPMRFDPSTDLQSVGLESEILDLTATPQYRGPKPRGNPDADLDHKNHEVVAESPHGNTPSRV